MKTNKNTLILVTGAAGKTGAAVVEQMLDHGFPVRALVRRLDNRSARLESLGAEVVVGDLHDLKSMRAAMNKVKRVYFVSPPQGELLVEATTIVAVAARDVGVEALARSGILTAGQGKVELLDLDSYLGRVEAYDPTQDSRISAWEACHYLAAAITPPYGEEMAGRLARRLGGLANDARDLAYRP